MVQISVVSSTAHDGWMCAVQVTEPDGQTRHSVTVSRQDFQRLTAGKGTTPEELVRRSFEFLLERGPKESILRQFDLPSIDRHFPEYSAEICKKFAEPR